MRCAYPNCTRQAIRASRCKQHQIARRGTHHNTIYQRDCDEHKKRWLRGGNVNCHLCGVTMTTRKHLQCDHEHAGNPDSRLLPACSECNRRRQNRTIAEFKNILRKEGRIR